MTFLQNNLSLLSDVQGSGAKMDIVASATAGRFKRFGEFGDAILRWFVGTLVFRIKKDERDNLREVIF